MAKIMVTGGAGFIGSHIVEAYLADGHTVSVVDNLATGNPRNVPEGIPFYQLDVTKPELEKAFEREKPNVVNHLAAQMDVRRSTEDPLHDANTNILGGLNTLELSRKYGVKKLLFASTGGAIYGEPKELPASESVRPEPLSHYGVSKLAFEQYLRLYKRLYGFRYTILRFPNVYGPRQNPHGEAGVCAILLGKMLKGETPTLYGHGKPTRDYVYVGDIARANVDALRNGDGRTINLGSGKGTSVKELYDILAELTEFKGEPNYEDLRPGEVEHIYTTGQRAETLLGWKPKVDLQEGLKRTLLHVQNNA